MTQREDYEFFQLQEGASEGAITKAYKELLEYKSLILKYQPHRIDEFYVQYKGADEVYKRLINSVRSAKPNRIDTHNDTSPKPKTKNPPLDPIFKDAINSLNQLSLIYYNKFNKKNIINNLERWNAEQKYNGKMSLSTRLVMGFITDDISNAWDTKVLENNPVYKLFRALKMEVVYCFDKLYLYDRSESLWGAAYHINIDDQDLIKKIPVLCKQFMIQAKQGNKEIFTDPSKYFERIMNFAKLNENSRQNEDQSINLNSEDIDVNSVNNNILSSTDSFHTINLSSEDFDVNSINNNNHTSDSFHKNNGGLTLFNNDLNNNRASQSQNVSTDVLKTKRIDALSPSEWLDYDDLRVMEFNIDNVVLTREQYDDIRNMAHELEKEIKSFWPYPNKDLKQKKIDALYQLITNVLNDSSGKLLSTHIKDIREKFQLVDAGKESRVKILLDKLSDNAIKPTSSVSG